MSFVKVYIHAVWATKNRLPILEQSKRKDLFKHMHQNALKKEIFMESVNGHKDHVHCLFRLRNDQTISKSIQLIKGESSHWANQQQLFSEKLVWQKEYFAVSVSESIVEKVGKYIQNQEDHHKRVTWEEEYNQFINKYGFNIFKG